MAKTLKRVIPTNPNLYVFLEGLQTLVRDAQRDLILEKEMFFIKKKKQTIEAILKS